MAGDEQAKFDEQWEVLFPWLEWWAKREANPKSDPIANPTGEGAGSYVSGVTIADCGVVGLRQKLFSELQAP